MERIKKIMVGLDFSEMDKTLIRNAAFFGKMVDAGEIYFVSVNPAVENDISEISHPFNERMVDKIKKELKNQSFPEDKIKTIVEVIGGAPLENLLDYTVNKDIDLVILGKKNVVHGSGVFPDIYTRHSPCSVLFVPQDAGLEFRNILLPTDFSSYSKLAFEKARFFKNEWNDTKLLGLNIYKVPLGYFKSGKSYAQYEKLMRHNAELDFVEFIRKNGFDDLQVEKHFVLENGKGNAKLINDFARSKNCDLIIMGAKGHSAATFILLGSNTEKLLKYHTNIPVLILKKKGETLSFLKALKQL